MLVGASCEQWECVYMYIVYTCMYMAILIMCTVSTQGLFAAYISSGFEEFGWK